MIELVLPSSLSETQKYYFVVVIDKSKKEKSFKNSLLKMFEGPVRSPNHRHGLIDLYVCMWFGRVLA